MKTLIIVISLVHVALVGRLAGANGAHEEAFIGWRGENYVPDKVRPRKGRLGRRLHDRGSRRPG